jgi:hypothetical protein
MLYRYKEPALNKKFCLDYETENVAYTCEFTEEEWNKTGIYIALYMAADCWLTLKEFFDIFPKMKYLLQYDEFDINVNNSTILTSECYVKFGGVELWENVELNINMLTLEELHSKLKEYK